MNASISEAECQLADALPGLLSGAALPASRLRLALLDDGGAAPLLVLLDERGARELPPADEAEGAAAAVSAAAFDSLHSLLLARSARYAESFFARVAAKLTALPRGDADADADADAEADDADGAAPLIVAFGAVGTSAAATDDDDSAAPPPIPFSPCAVVAPALAAAAAASLVEQVATFLGDGAAERDVLLFAYASLIWRPEPGFDEGVPCVARGFRRRFWQLSDDHRGCAAAPGRACTLIAAAACAGGEDGGGGGGGSGGGEEEASAEAECAGQLYTIAAPRAREVLEQLAVREKAGYSLVRVSVTLADGGGEREAVAFAANADTCVYLVPPGAGRSVAATAEVIQRARGKSGTNMDYFRALLDAMRARGVVDAHLEALDAHISRGAQG